MTSDYDAVLTSLYEATVTRDRWSEALQDLAELSGSRGALAVSFDSNHLELLHSPGLSATVAQFFEQGWHLNDYRTSKSVPLGRRGFVADQHIIDHDELPRSAYYGGFAGPAGVPWFASCGIALPNGRILGFSLQRSEKEGAFSFRDLERLNRMLPRLREILLLAHRIGVDRDRTIVSGLELVQQAAILFDSRGLICNMNPAAEALVGNVFSTHSRKLIATDHRQRFALANSIDAACVHPYLSNDASPQITRIESAQGRPWIAQVAPVTGRAKDIFGNAHALLILTPAYSQPRLVHHTLSTAFGLTQAETGVAELLAMGLSTNEMADRLHISRNAVRFHIKSILPKANVQRQAAFVAVATSLLAKSGATASFGIDDTG